MLILLTVFGEMACLLYSNVPLKLNGMKSNVYLLENKVMQVAQKYAQPLYKEEMRSQASVSIK